MSDYMEVAAIDRLIRAYPWMDFEVVRCSRWELLLQGSIDPSSEPDVTIAFEDLAFVALPLEWKTDTSEQVFSICTGTEAVELNVRYRVEQGYSIYEFRAEDDLLCRIAARQVKATQHRAPPKGGSAYRE